MSSNIPSALSDDSLAVPLASTCVHTHFALVRRTFRRIRFPHVFPHRLLRLRRI